MSSVCRVCLVGDIKMYSLENHILEIYEKLTTNNLSARGPQAVCYICHSLLQRCHKFAEMALCSEKTLQDLLNKGIEVSHENILKLNPSIQSSLSASFMQIIDFNNIKSCVDSPNIKQELVVNQEDFFVKEEFITSEEELVVENEYTEEPVVTAVDRPMEYVMGSSLSESTNFEDKKTARCCYTSQNIKSLDSYNFVDKKIFVCNQCGIKFSHKKKLSAHIQTHSQVKFACDMCNQKFTSKSLLRRHILYTHKKDKPQLTIYMRTRSGDRPHACSVCKKSFPYKSDLTKHMRTHTGERPYTCDVCFKSYPHKFQISRHKKTHTERTHTRERPYLCDVCDKTFCHKTSLTVHMRTHTGERPYTCKVCDKSFSATTVLSKHLRTHTGEKPYGCHVCDKFFSYKSNLTVHMRTHSGERPYTCDVCAKSFSQKSVLSSHLRTHWRKAICVPCM